jgi:hypothetical protein
MIPHPTIPRFYIIESYIAFQEIFMVNSIPKPDFSNIEPNKVSIDETPKVPQGLIECGDSDNEGEK